MSDCAELDPASVVRLTATLAVGWAIEPTGVRRAWLLVGDPAAGAASREVPAHEEEGRLPVEFHERLRGTFRCGAETREGKRCMMRVPPGERCRIHAGVTR